MLQTKSKLYFVCGFDNGTIEIRRSNNLRAVVSSFKVQTNIRTICELTDGSFVSGSKASDLERWNRSGTVLQTFDHLGVLKVIELRSDVIVSATDTNLKVWRVSTGECLHTLNESLPQNRLTELCCAAISAKEEMYNAEELKSVLPEELYALCFGCECKQEKAVTSITPEQPLTTLLDTNIFSIDFQQFIKSDSIDEVL